MRQKLPVKRFENFIDELIKTKKKIPGVGKYNLEIDKS